jgi:hypothetical protein
MSKIGFNLSHGMDDPLDGLEEIDVETALNDLLANKLIADILNPPEWQIDYEQTLFWAVVFNTHHKVNQC